MQTNTAQTQQEITHITEEIYKKNLELALNNRTLSVLRTIDELILSSVTDPKQIAQTVASLILKEEIASDVEILLLDKEKKNLHLLAIQQNSSEQNKTNFISRETLPLTDIQNPIVQCVLQKKMISPENDKSVSDNTLLFIYPLVIKNEPIGAIRMKIQKVVETLLPFHTDLMERLANVVGIAINDALLYQDIQSANESLKQLDQLKDEFVALASHELRNPMVSVKLYLWELLQQPQDVGTLTDKQKEIILHSYDSTIRLLNLVSDMLDVSKIESGKLSLQIQPQNIENLISESLAEIVPAAAKQNINVIFQKPNAINLQVLADSQKTKQVIINLLSNAVKFSFPQNKIEIFITEGDKTLDVSIHDYGRGIPPKLLPKLFQKYSRLHTKNPEDKIIEGTGLGLYLSKKVIELQQGTIKAESEGVNKGATFTFTLPKVT